jgi:hypothetical protein
MVSSLNEKKARAEATFKRKQEQAREGAEAWTEYEAERRTVDEKIARLKALRLAKEAAEAGAEGKKESQAPNKLSPRSRRNRDPRKILPVDLQPHE